MILRNVGLYLWVDTAQYEKAGRPCHQQRLFDGFRKDKTERPMGHALKNCRQCPVT
jgi:hypothetical protein